MRNLEEALKLDVAGMEAETAERKSLLDQMVGTLYPSILWVEIRVLREAIWDAAYKNRI